MTTYTSSAPATLRRSPAAWTVLLVLGSVFIGQQIVTGGSTLRVVAAGTVMVALAIPSLERPRSAVTGLFIILPVLGAVRHMFLSSSGAAFLDPLLLITTAVAITIFVSLVLSGEMDWGGTALGTAVFLFILMGLLHVFNPGQNGLLVGLAGVMINVVPVGFFFIGRSIGDAAFVLKILRIVMIMGAIAALYGLYQVFVGFLGFEAAWLQTQSYTAQVVGNTIRPHAFFNNAAEFASYAHFAFITALAWLLFSKRSSKLTMLALVGLIGYSGFLIGSRGFTVKIGLGVVILLAVRARNRLLATGVVILLAGLVVFWSSSTTSDLNIQDREAGASQLIEQQLRALRDPFDRTKSTLPVHFDQATESIRYAIEHQPFGLGTGAPTSAGTKFQGVVASSELDIGDMFLAYGVPGGVLFILIILLGIRAASRARRALPGPAYVAIWAILITSIGVWLNGGLYSITPLVWFLLGSADRAYKTVRDRGLMEPPELAGTLPA